jgi:hypothetical protein
MDPRGWIWDWGGYRTRILQEVGLHCPSSNNEWITFSLFYMSLIFVMQSVLKDILRLLASPYPSILCSWSSLSLSLRSNSIPPPSGAISALQVEHWPVPMAQLLDLTRPHHLSPQARHFVSHRRCGALQMPQLSSCVA